ncbi:DNA mismatch repair protein [Trapelia coarctata]|nr:DNA mismatch repair protein [Trapelia coarctata]
MPVRVKQRPIRDEDRKAREREWDWLRKNVTGAILAWGRPVTLSIQGSDKDQKLRFRVPAPSSEMSRSLTEQPIQRKSFDLELIRNTLQQGAGIDPKSWKPWVKTSARTPYMTIRGTISLEPAPSKETQYICLGNQYIGPDNGYNVLYGEVNRLFALSRFGIQEEEDALRKKAKAEKLNDKRFKVDGFTNNELRGAGKGIDRWPRFFIRIELHSGNPVLLKQNRILAEQRDKLSLIIEVMEAMINGFLAEHYLRPRKGRSGKPDVPSGPISNPQPKKSVRFLEPSTSSATVSEGLEQGQSQEQEPRPDRLAPSDLGGGNVKLPKFSRSRSSGSTMTDTFSGWSRIKGLSKRDRAAMLHTKCLSGLPSTKLPESPLESTQSTPAIEDHIQPSDSWKEGLSEAPRRASTPSTGEPQTDPADACPSGDCGNHHKHVSATSVCSKPLHDEEGIPDALIAWTDPITRNNVKVNARTGSVIEERPKSRYSYTGASDTTNSAHQRLRSSRLKRLETLRSTSDCFLAPKAGSWAASLLETWENPIFRRSEEAIPHLSMKGPYLDDGSAKISRYPEVDLEGTFKDASDSCAVRLTKQGLASATVIAQVDRKFILIRVAMTSPAEETNESPHGGGDDYAVVLVDQHAADERIRIESLLADLCTKATESTAQVRSQLGLRSSIDTMSLSKPVAFKISGREHTLFKQNASYFATWGILYDLSLPSQGISRSDDLQNSKLVVLTLPESIAERCRIDVKHLADFLRGEVWKREEAGISHVNRIDPPPTRTSNSARSSPREPVNVLATWPHRIRDCPQGVIDMLNSRACRSAIMFNDELTYEDCRTLVKKLAMCSFPFQCAHGRPSMIPLANVDSADDLEHGGIGSRSLRRIGRKEMDFREAWKCYLPA